MVIVYIPRLFLNLGHTLPSVGDCCKVHFVSWLDALGTKCAVGVKGGKSMTGIPGSLLFNMYHQAMRSLFRVTGQGHQEEIKYVQTTWNMCDPGTTMVSSSYSCVNKC